MSGQEYTAPGDLEQAMGELERIIGELESGDLGLEKSLARYEEGNRLIRHCRHVLERAEQRIEGLASEQPHPGETGECRP